MKVSSFTIEHTETHVSGDTAYDVGTYRQALSMAGAAPIQDAGKYIVVAKRQKGAWRIAYVAYNSDLPPPAMPAPAAAKTP